MSASIASAGDPGADAAAIEAMFEGGMTLSFVGVGLYGVYVLAAFIPSIAVTVRRFHDRDMSGWWYLGLTVAGVIPFIGFLGSIAFLVLMFLPGTPGSNRFGSDPKDPLTPKTCSPECIPRRRCRGLKLPQRLRRFGA
jgi:uncharacterized membrane protein YhaH (DUF805 family)